MKKIYVRELLVPEDAVLEVSTLFSQNEIDNQIVGSDEEDELITLEVRYEKREKKAIEDIVGLIDNYEEEINDDDDEEGDD